jgi:hypothetical protein
MVDEKTEKTETKPGQIKSSVLAHKASGKDVSTLAATPPEYAKQDDMWPRPPRTLTGFNDLNAGAYDLAPGFPGMIVDTGLKDVISAVPETDIAFACAVAAGAKSGFCKLATAGGDYILGIAVASFTAGWVDPVTGTQTAYKANSGSCSILRVGRIWAIPATAVKVGDPVGFDANGVLGAAGMTSVPGAVWATDAAANELAVVQINKVI